ncbi:MAG: hypothetical protein LUF68_02325, partial [Clostridiales bacterium]|nr:hypothetical protein [Clostridiales bacterium]
MEGNAILNNPQNNSQNSSVLSEVQLKSDIIFKFKDWLIENGFTKATAERYESALRQISIQLPSDKTIGRGTLQHLQDKLLMEGYAPTTINLYFSVANKFLEYCGLRELQFVTYLPIESVEQPELSRSEYLILLATARRLDKHRDYLMIKLFATTGIAISEVVKLSTIDVKKGKFTVFQNRVNKLVELPHSLQAELLDYARIEGRNAGPIFITKKGTLVNRSNITISIAALAEPAGLPKEKCTPICLRKLYQASIQEIEDEYDNMVKRTYDDMIDKEQML